MKVFIGLSVSENIDSKYFSLAKEVSKYLADLKYHLVCGASRCGLAKEIIGFFKEKTSVYGVILDHYKEALDYDYEIVDSNFKRLEKCYQLSDLFIILPGGIGTLSELFGMLEELRNYNDKRIILFNYETYYDNLIKFMEEGINNNFIKREDLNKVIIVKTINEFKKEVLNYGK